MDITKNPPPGNQGLAFQTHALQMILFGPFYVRTQHCYGSLQNRVLTCVYIYIYIYIYFVIVWLIWVVIYKLNMVVVRSRFVTNHNGVGFARKKAQTISFVEHRFERLGLGHQAVGFSWYPYMVKLSSPLESFSWRRAGRLWFLTIFPSPCYELLTFPFILACVFLSFVHV